VNSTLGKSHNSQSTQSMKLFKCRTIILNQSIVMNWFGCSTTPSHWPWPTTN